METTLAIENVGTWFNPHSRELDRAGLQRRWVRDHDVEVEQREHAEDGLLYAILKDGDSTREEPVDLFPFADVQVGPNCEFGSCDGEPNSAVHRDRDGDPGLH